MNSDQVKILITGASGFIGSHLIKSLASQRFKLRCTTRKTTHPESQNKIEWQSISDFCDYSEWNKATKGIDYIIHLAALAHQVGDTVLSVEDYRQANTLPTRIIAETARDNSVKRIVFISSVAAIGAPSNGYTIDDTTSPRPDTPYGISKREAEIELSNALSHSLKTDWIALRPSLVYGPGNPGNMKRIARLIGSGIPLPFSGIKNQRSFLYVENLISAILIALKAPFLSEKIYLISDDQSVSTFELARLIAKAQGKPLRSFSMPNASLRGIAKTGDLIKRVTGRSIGVDSYSLEKLKASLRIDNSGFKRDANWKTPYSLQEGIKRTFATFKQ